MIENKIYAGIVTFEPDLIRLSDNLKSICKQVEEVIVFENGSSEQDKIVKLTEEYNNVSIICSDSNLGIASALNRLMAARDGMYDWMLTLDQDSVCPTNYIEIMASLLNAEADFGIVAPVIYDRNVGIVGHNPEGEYGYVKTCISSGSLVSMDAWRDVGGYDELLFIDSVDLDLCYRIWEAGYKVIQTRKAKLYHEIGKSEKRRLLFWRVTVRNHSAFRKYYIARNNIYYPLKNKMWLHFIRGNWRNLWLLFIIFCYETEKKEKMKSVIKGWRDGYRLKRV